jgi:hypothetical protein
MKQEEPMPKQHEAEKPRTTSQLWSRLETINRRRAELDAEAAEITATLEAVLHRTPIEGK